MNTIRKKRKYRFIKTKRRCSPTQKEREKMLLVKKLYDELGTLDKVGDSLSLTRERIRQILNKGQRYNLFKYELTREKKFKEAISSIGRETLVEQIKTYPNKFDVSSNLGIDINTLLRLIKFYNIDLESYREEARYKKVLTRYSKMVNILGYHPSTTEMQHDREWRTVWAGIDRLWGSVELFRREFGIDRPKFRLSANTINAFKKLCEQRIINKNKKILEIERIVRFKGPISCRKLSEITGFSYQSTYGYIQNLKQEGKIQAVGLRSSTGYECMSY